MTPVREEFRPIFQVVRPRTRTFFGTWRAIEASFRASRDGISRRRSGPGDPKNGPKFRSDCREKTLNVRHLGQSFFPLNDTELASLESHSTQISGLFPPGISGPNRGHFGHTSGLKMVAFRVSRAGILRGANSGKITVRNPRSSAGALHGDTGGDLPSAEGMGEPEDRRR